MNLKELSNFLLLIFIFFSCSFQTNYYKKTVNVFPKDATKWNLAECNEILDFYTTDNFSDPTIKTVQKVYIKVLMLNKTSIKALARKEVIERRLQENDFYNILETYLREFTSLTYNNKRNEIIEVDPNYSNGYSFKIFFENISNPYERIFLQNGYSYFFLENMNGDFSRVINVTGRFVEDYFQLDDYLYTNIRFSPFATNNKRLFDSKDLNESYKLVFNGLQMEPIVIKWNVK